MNRNNNNQIIVNGDDNILVLSSSYYTYEIVQFENAINTIFDTFFNDNLNDLRIDTGSILDTYGTSSVIQSDDIQGILTFINSTYTKPTFDGREYGDTETLTYSDNRTINWFWNNISIYGSDFNWDTANISISGSEFRWRSTSDTWQIVE